MSVSTINNFIPLYYIYHYEINVRFLFPFTCRREVYRVPPKSSLFQDFHWSLEYYNNDMYGYVSISCFLIYTSVTYVVGVENFETRFSMWPSVNVVFACWHLRIETCASFVVAANVLVVDRVAVQTVRSSGISTLHYKLFTFLLCFKGRHFTSWQILSAWQNDAKHIMQNCGT